MRSNIFPLLLLDHIYQDEPNQTSRGPAQAAAQSRVDEAEARAAAADERARERVGAVAAEAVRRRQAAESEVRNLKRTLEVRELPPAPLLLCASAPS